MVDFQVSYNDYISAKEKYEADIQAQILINRAKNHQYIQNRILLQDTLNSILTENLEGIKSFLGDKYTVILGNNPYKVAYSSYDADDVICTYTNISFKPSNEKDYDSFLRINFGYFNVKDLKWTTTDDLTNQINKLLGEFVAERKLYGIKNIFGQYIKIIE